MESFGVQNLILKIAVDSLCDSGADYEHQRHAPSGQGTSGGSSQQRFGPLLFLGEMQ